MVKCESELGGGGGPILGEPGGNGGGVLLDSVGFRLDDADLPELPDPLGTLTSTSASSYSIYKQRIDSMFDETRSLLSCGYGTTTTMATATGMPPPPPPPPPPLPARLEGAARTEAERLARKGANVVQARIEKMFAEMSSGNGRCGVAGGHRFSVDYLGSVPLTDKVTTLQGLQGPLKDLYFGYRRARGGGGGADKPAQWEPGFLEISGSGLRVHHSERDQGQQCQLEQINPFPRIAVWAAVQFVCRERGEGGERGSKQGMECAFLPLIADPGGVDKDALFRELSGAEERVIRSMTSILRATATSSPDGSDAGPGSASHHAPMFAVVMRKVGVSRQLECHGFVCSSSEDAIVMAANLYQALMANMRAASDPGEPGEAPNGQEAQPAAGEGVAGGQGASTGQVTNGAGGARLLAGRVARMHHENGIGRLSIAGSVCGDSSGQNSGSGSGSAESSCSNNAGPEDAASLASQQQQLQQQQHHHQRQQRPHWQQQQQQQDQKLDSQSPPQKQKQQPPPLPKLPPPIPKRPPRKNKKSSGSSNTSDDNEDLIVLEDTSPLQPSSRSKALLACTSSGSSLRGNYLTKGGHGRARPSKRSEAEEAASHAASLAPAGDILTKVTIPRSHSFLNANGPLTRYGRRPVAHSRGGTGVDPGLGRGVQGGGRPGGGGSPLGFNELFTEFRQQEGLDSLDDILDAIIDAEGMSFNDLKPIYKEFLLKLALTLTKDELYHRSKSIMRRQRKKQQGPGGRPRRRGIAYTAVYIKRAVRRSINKLRPSKRLARLPHVDFSMLFMGGGGKAVAHKKKSKKKKAPPPKTATSTSMSSYPSSNFRMSRRPSISVSQAMEAACNVNVNVSINNNNNRASNKTRLPRRRSSRRNSRTAHQPPPPPLGTSTSEDSDFFTMIRCDSSARTAGLSGASRMGGKGSGGHPNRSSSGYVSCSDCSYDSESCTCLSAERCYCSLSKHRPHPAALPGPPPGPASRGCACDTDSCQGSDKCYCSQRDSPSASPSSCCRTRGHPGRRQRQRQHGHAPHPGPPLGPPPANIFEQLRQQGFAASDSSLSRAESPLTAWRKNETRVSRSPGHGQGHGQGHGHGHRSGTTTRATGGAGERRRQRANSSAGSMRSSRSLEFLQGPLLGHLLPQQQYPAWAKDSHSKAGRDGSVRSRCPSRMDMYRSEQHRANGRTYIQGLAVDTAVRRAGRSIAGSQHTGRASSKPASRPSSRAGSRAGSWVCEDDDEEVQDEEELLLGDASSSRRSRQQRKVLVVSARDPSGRVIYMGASSASSRQSVQGRGQSEALAAGQFFPRASLSYGSVHGPGSGRRQSRASQVGRGLGHAPLTGKKSDPYAASGMASEALSVKKSAEIAALFTGVKVSQTTDIVARSTDVTDSSTTAGDGEEVIYSSLDGQQGQGPAPGQARTRQGMYLSHSGASLENSLGYLP